MGRDDILKFSARKAVKQATATQQQAAKTACIGTQSRRKNVQGDRRGTWGDAGMRENVHVPLQASGGEKKVRTVQ